MLNKDEKEAIEIVKKFNLENRFKYSGKLNNAIDTIVRIAEKQEINNNNTKKWLIKKIDNLALCYKTFIRKRSRKKRFRYLCF